MSINEDQENALSEADLSDPDACLIVPPHDGAPRLNFRADERWRECRIWHGYLNSSLILRCNIEISGQRRSSRTGILKHINLYDQLDGQE